MLELGTSVLITIAGPVIQMQVPLLPKTTASRKTPGVTTSRKSGNLVSPDATTLINNRRNARLSGDMVLFRALRKKVDKILREAEET